MKTKEDLIEFNKWLIEQNKVTKGEWYGEYEPTWSMDLNEAIDLLIEKGFTIDTDTYAVTGYRVWIELADDKIMLYDDLNCECCGIEIEYCSYYIKANFMTERASYIIDEEEIDED